MKFSTVELFQLNLIYLNQIISVSNHKCLNWESNSVLIRAFSLSWIIPVPQRECLVLKIPLFIRKGPCLSISYLFICFPVSFYWSYTWQNFTTFTCSGSSHSPWVLLTQNGCKKVGPFVEPIIFITFSSMSMNTFSLKVSNIHIILHSHDVFSGESTGGLWLTLWSGLNIYRIMEELPSSRINPSIIPSGKI